MGQGAKKSVCFSEPEISPKKVNLSNMIFFEQGTPCLCQAEYPILISRWDPAGGQLCCFPEYNTSIQTRGSWVVCLRAMFVSMFVGTLHVHILHHGKPSFWITVTPGV